MYARPLFALLLLPFALGSVHADDHIYLSCSHAHQVKKTTFEDGHVQRKAEKDAATFAIDVDLEQKTINGFYDAPYGQRLENGSVTIGGLATKTATERESGYQDTISIDRLSGTAIVIHRYLPPDDCAGGMDHGPSCRLSETTTTYRCVPAVAGFPTPIPRMMRSFERFRRSAFVVRVRRALRRAYTSMDLQAGPSHAH
jgi:hypothetical protein